ncbi:MAG: D-2-hydroxyacid dehydrogenase [Alphaproteobacteria bacterium]|nr:D-2-hydroxyacid dehydrogenase [Alphaproteobacteria bacterium]
MVLKLFAERLLIVVGEPGALSLDRVNAWTDIEVRVASTEAAVEQALTEFSPTIAFGISGDGIEKPVLRRVLTHPGLRWFSNAGAGVEHLTPWDPDAVTVTNAAGVLSDFLAEFTLTAVQMANIGFPRLAAQQRQSHWQQLEWTPLAGKTISVIGLGHVGRAVARRAKALGMHVIGLRARAIDTPEVDEVFPAERLCNLMARADFVSVHAASTPETKGLIGPSEFSCMHRGVVVLNMARGPVVDEEALLISLDNGKIESAFLDVFNVEPLPNDHPFWRHERVVVTPHIADNVPDWRRRMFDAFLDNLDRARRGAPLQSVVDPARGY